MNEATALDSLLPVRNIFGVNDQKSISRIPHQFSTIGYVNILNINGRLTHLNVPLQAQKQSRKGYVMETLTLIINDRLFFSCTVRLVRGAAPRESDSHGTQTSYTQMPAKVHTLSILCSGPMPMLCMAFITSPFIYFYFVATKTKS